MWRWILLILVIALGAWVYFFLDAAGVFLDIKPKELGACKPVTGVVGVEDLTIDPETKLAYLSGYDRRAVFAGQNPAGSIWVLDLNTPDAAPVDASAGLVATGFQPHGISLYRAPDGKKTLFAINHANKRHTIEVFDVNGPTLTHRGTVSGPELVSPNDIVGVGSDSFYVTNDHANAAGFMRTLEDYLRLRMTTVQFYDGAKFSTALSGIGGANGINVSVDGKSLYLSAASERMVHVYDRDPGTNVLTERATVAVPGFADNIELLADGNLLLGLHSKILELLAHVGDASKPSPSHIMRLVNNGQGGFTPETVYYNLGDEISGASVGASIDNRVLIGAIFDAKILDCTLEKPL